jgi:hypothetical protein
MQFDGSFQRPNSPLQVVRPHVFLHLSDTPTSPIFYRFKACLPARFGLGASAGLAASLLTVAISVASSSCSVAPAAASAVSCLRLAVIRGLLPGPHRHRRVAIIVIPQTSHSSCHGDQIPYLLHICFRTILTLSAFHIGR